MTQPEQPLTPDWWVRRLYRRLQEQARTFELYDAYYRGEPPRLPWLPEQAQDEFARLLKLTKANYMGLVIDSMVERMQIEGFRVGDQPDADAGTWDIWQASNMDSLFDQVLLESAICGSSYLLVAPNPDRPDRPLLHAEHPTQAIVEYAPGTARQVRAAGLKVWLDDWTSRLMATLYLPDGIFKYEADAPRSGAVPNPQWRRRAVAGESWPAPNPLGEVPLVEIANNPRLLSGGVSEIADVIGIQDRIHKTLADRLMTQDFGAFPQKWATGFPEEDDDGNENRIDVGRNRMVTSDVEETRFGQWDAAPLDPYSGAKREDVKDVASRTRTPAQYLLGEMSNVNGETLKASESGLVSKVRQRHRTSGEGAEDAAGLARRVAQLAGQGERIEAIWRNPEFRTEGELMDALVKARQTLQVPVEALWERWGASQEEIRRWSQMLDAEAERDPIGAATRSLGQQDLVQG
ncbi:phage portal protein [Micromonospora robiginosa]|uniref:Phage portal protein n=1 Tax=Micromonospora robiginosa TaxID=2749844 RepID=A0A7L6B8V6_9ACTN|nr:phage portal protein [Micromonospora ferruginea]QLQ37980.1 phage portal protein [Micromonospora ferruginea]